MRLQKILQIVFLGVFFALLVARLFHLNQAPFLNDEPRLLVEVEKSFQENRWPKVGPVGSQPIPYGPIPHWFYQIVRGISDSPEAYHWAHGLVFLLATLLIFLMANFFFGFSSAIFMGILLASSPYLFLYSQMPWEVLLVVPGSILLAFSFLVDEISKSKTQKIQAGILAGLGLAICLGTHLMSGSLAITFALVVVLNFYFRGSWRDGVFFLLPALVVFVMVLFPYFQGILQFLELNHLPSTEKNPLWGNGRQLWWSILKSPMYLSGWQMKYFLEPEEILFFESVPKLLERIFYLDLFGWMAKLLFWVSWVWIGISIFQKKLHSPLFLLAWLSVPVHVFVLQVLNLATYPHYFLPIWWVPFFLLNLVWQKKYLRPILVVSLIFNFVFLFSFVEFIHDRQGTRGDFYGTTFQEQKRLFESACKENMGALRFDLSEVRLQLHSAHFFLTKLQDCKGKTREVSKVPLSGPHFRLVYGEGARLTYEVKQ